MTHHYTQFVCRPWIILHAANVPSQSSPRILHMTNKTRINTIKLPRLTLQHHRPLSTQIEHLHHDYMLTLQLFPTSQSLPPPQPRFLPVTPTCTPIHISYYHSLGCAVIVSPLHVWCSLRILATVPAMLANVDKTPVLLVSHLHTSLDPMSRNQSPPIGWCKVAGPDTDCYHQYMTREIPPCHLLIWGAWDRFNDPPGDRLPWGLTVTQAVVDESPRRFEDPTHQHIHRFIESL